MNNALLDGVIEAIAAGVGEERIRQAADLLTRHQCPNFKSGDAEVDGLVLTAEEATRLRLTLQQAIRHEQDLRRAGSLAWALSKMALPDTRDVVQELLVRSLRQLLDSNGTLFQCLIALDNAGLLERSATTGPRSMTEIDENVAMARAYLQTLKILVPW